MTRDISSSIKNGMILLAMASSILVLNAPALAQYTWTPKINVSSDYGRFGHDGQMVVDSYGTLHTVYGDFWFDDTGHNYYTYSTDGGQTWATPYALQYTNGKPSAPRICITPDDMVHVFYGKGDVQWRYKPVSGGTWSAPVELSYDYNGNDGGYVNGAVVDSTGGICMVWSKLFDGDGPTRSAVWSRYKPFGGSWQSAELIAGTSDEHKFPTGTYLALDEGDGNNGTTFWCGYSYDKKWYHKRKYAGTSWQPGGWGTPAPTGIRYERVAWNPVANEMAAAFIIDVDGDADKYWLEVFIAISIDNGNTWSERFNLSNAKALDRSPQIAYDDNGNLHVVWEGFGCDGCKGKLFYRGRIAGAWYQPVNLGMGDGSFPAFDGLVPDGNTLYNYFGQNLGDPWVYDMLLITADLSSVPTQVGTLHGTVYDQHGQGVPNVTIQAEQGGMALSQADGSYTLPMVVGTYDVTATKEFYDSDTAGGVTITEGASIAHDFHITALPPASPGSFRVSATDGNNRLFWWNSGSGNYYATVIRYRTDTYPTGPDDGTLLLEYVGDPSTSITYDHDTVTNGLTYYYAAFSRDNQSHIHYSEPALAEGTPQAPPRPNLLTNGELLTFSNNIATGWTGYRANDANNAMQFFVENNQYVEQPPAQGLLGIDNNNLPHTGYSASGIMQQVSGITPGKVYQLCGFQDLYCSDWGADHHRYIMNFGINPTGGTDPGQANAEGSIGGAKWMTADQALWNKDSGSPVYFSGYHRSWASFPAEASTISVWSGVSISNEAAKDSHPIVYYTDTLKLFEWDFPANASLVNGDLEGAVIDLQNGDDTGGGGDRIPQGWIPAGGGIGQWNAITVEEYAAHSGNAGLHIGHRRGTIFGGIMQKIAATPGREQTFTAWVKASGQDYTLASVGIDPTGGGDITSPYITWVSTPQSVWTELSVSAIAQGSAVTVFLRAGNNRNFGSGNYHTCVFDECTFTEDDAPLPGHISGIVTDRCGTPVAGATVATTFGGYTTTSQVDGSYLLSDVNVGIYTVTASKSGYDLAEADAVTVQTEQTTTQDIILLPTTRGHIDGFVLDDCSNPIAGATVQTTTGCYSDITAADGSYTIADIPVDTYDVVVTAAGYLQQQQTIAVSDGQTAAVNFSLDPATTGAVSGTVQDICGHPVAGATVIADPSCYSTITASDGSFSLTGVKTGTYTLITIKDGYFDHQQIGTVVINQQTTVVNPTMTPAYDVEQLTNGDFESGFFSFWGGDMANQWGAGWRGEFVAADWAYQFQGSGHGTVVHLKDLAPGFEAGIRQEVTGLTPGTPWRCTAQAYQFDTSTTAWMAVDTDSGVDLPASGMRFSNVAGQWTTLELSGTVDSTGRLRINLWAFNEGDGDSDIYFDNASLVITLPASTPGTVSGYVRDIDDAPLAGVTVQANPGGYTTLSQADGSYSLPNLEAGTYDITASGEDYGQQTHANIAVTACDLIDLDFNLQPVIWTWNNILLNGDFESGFFSFWGGDIGNHWGATWSSDPYEGGTYDEEIFADGHNYTMQLKNIAGGFKVGVRQELLGLTPGQRYRVSAEAYQNGTGTTCWLAVDEGSGVYLPTEGTAFTNIAGQWNYLEIEGTVGASGTARVNLSGFHESGSATDVFFDNVKFELATATLVPGTISGVVRDIDNNPISGATVSTDTGGYSTTSLADGSYTLNDVQPGTYAVTASHPNFAAQTQSGMQVSGDQTTTVDFYLQSVSWSSVLVNGNFEGGFFGFWGGTIANSWGATWGSNFEDHDQWDDAYPDATHGFVMRIKNLDSGTRVGIRQEVTGLTPGDAYQLTAQAYQFSTGVTAWMAVDTGTGVELPATGTQFPNTAGQWNTQQVSGTVDATGTVRVNLWAYRQSGDQADVYFNDVVLLVGSAPDPLPIINRQPTALSALAYEGYDADAQSFTLRNSGSGTLNYTITDNANWLSVSPASGTSTGESDTITVNFQTTGLSIGNYNASITVSDPNAANPTATIAVSLEIAHEPAPPGVPDMDTDGDVDQADFAELQRCFTGSGLALPVGCQSADLDGDNDVDRYDVARFQLCATGPGVPLNEACADIPMDNIVPDKAHSPQPADAAVDVSIDAILDFSAGSAAASHDVYFGTSNPPAFRGNRTLNQYDPGTLMPFTTYYWRIDEVNDQGTTTGTVWSFTTEAADIVQNLNRYELAYLDAGDMYYIDRDFTITAMPANLAGQQGIRTANNDKLETATTWITFNLLVPADIYVAYDRRGTPPQGGTLPGWLQSFTDTTTAIDVTDQSTPMRLYMKHYGAGPVTLGGNLATPAWGASSNYFVIIVPSGG